MVSSQRKSPSLNLYSDPISCSQARSLLGLKRYIMHTFPKDILLNLILLDKKIMAALPFPKGVQQ